MLRRRAWPSPCRHYISVRRFACSPRALALQLAYTLHEPPQKERSKGPPGNAIVFVHGLFGSKKNNRSISKVLARDLNRPIYAIDLRNHGDSPHDPQHDYTALAHDVQNFLDEHNLENPTLIGHSMGAKTAMTVALTSPDRIANLVSVDNAPLDAALSNDFAKYIQGMRRIAEAKVTSQREADAILQEYEESLPVRQFLLTNLVRASDAAHQVFRIPIRILGNALDNMADFPFKDPSAARFEKPALFVRGTQSHYVADEALPLIGQFFPRFELVDIAAGHWVISENPEAFRRAVVEFLGDKL